MKITCHDQKRKPKTSNKRRGKKLTLEPTNEINFTAAKYFWEISFTGAKYLWVQLKYREKSKL